MTPQKIQEHIENGTFFDTLMQHVQVDAKPCGDGKTRLEIRFPEWYATHISDDSRVMIEALIRENALRCFSCSD